VRLLHYDLPFNYSAMNNMAVRDSRGEVVCLLNNDTEVISSGWLEEMVGICCNPRSASWERSCIFRMGRFNMAAISSAWAAWPTTPMPSCNAMIRVTATGRWWRRSYRR